MKGAKVLAIVGLAVGCGLYLYTQVWVAEDPGHLIAYACGNPKEGQVQIQVAVPYRMTRLDPPRVDEKGEFITWEQWIAEHFEIRNAAGELVHMQQAHFANLIPEAKVGTPDFYAVGSLAAGSPYTFDYLPLGIAQSKRYRHAFSVTDTGKPFERAHFGYVDEAGQ